MKPKFHAKMLEEFPHGKWIDGAGKCQYCSATYQVMLEDIDIQNNVAVATINIQHKPECLEDYEAIGESTNTDIAGWSYGPGYIEIHGKKYRGMSARSNIGLCAECFKINCDIPLILWSNDATLEVDFCWDCVEKLEIMSLIKAGQLNK